VNDCSSIHFCTSYIIHHTSYIIHHTSYITHHASYIIHHTCTATPLYSDVASIFCSNSDALSALIYNTDLSPLVQAKLCFYSLSSCLHRYYFPFCLFSSLYCYSSQKVCDVFCLWHWNWKCCVWSLPFDHCTEVCSHQLSLLTSNVVSQHSQYGV